MDWLSTLCQRRRSCSKTKRQISSKYKSGHFFGIKPIKLNKEFFRFGHFIIKDFFPYI